MSSAQTRFWKGGGGVDGQGPDEEKSPHWLSSFFHNLTHSDTLTRGVYAPEVPRQWDKALQEPAGIKATSAVLLDMVRGEQPLCYLYYKYFKG